MPSRRWQDAILRNATSYSQKRMAGSAGGQLRVAPPCCKHGKRYGIHTVSSGGVASMWQRIFKRKPSPLEVKANEVRDANYWLAADGMARQVDLFPKTIHVQSVDSSRNRARFCSMIKVRDLFGAWMLIER